MSFEIYLCNFDDEDWKRIYSIWVKEEYKCNPIFIDAHELTSITFPIEDNPLVVIWTTDFKDFQNQYPEQVEWLVNQFVATMYLEVARKTIRDLPMGNAHKFELPVAFDEVAGRLKMMNEHRTNNK